MKQVLEYLRYYLTAQTKFDVHSPFVFDLVTKVINDTTSIEGFEKIEKLRGELLRNHNSIQVTDFGTAWGGPKTYERKISAIAKHSAKPKKFGMLLSRIVKYFKPENILELGTSFGISTMYFASGNPASKIISIEGCPETAGVASGNFNKNNFKNIEIIIGGFDSTLSSALNKFQKIDFVFFDGNHQKNSTLNYFKQCLSHAQDKSIFIFDDINLSYEMKEAWLEIKSHPKVSVTVDLFMMGIVFFNPELSKQDFIIRF